MATRPTTSTIFRYGAATFTTCSSGPASGQACLRDHRAGHDCPRHRGAAGGAAVFLEEAAGVSAIVSGGGRPRAASPIRARTFPVEDIRVELGAQLARLDAQAKGATEYRDLESRHKQATHLLWFAKQQDAARPGAASRRDRQPRRDSRRCRPISCGRESPGRTARRSLQGRRRTPREAGCVLCRQRRSHASRAAWHSRARTKADWRSKGGRSH